MKLPTRFKKLEYLLLITTVTRLEVFRFRRNLIRTIFALPAELGNVISCDRTSRLTRKLIRDDRH